jgi:universal stress protein A
MIYPFRKILCPVDFDESSAHALVTAATMAREGAVVFVLHVVPLFVPPTSMPVYVDVYKGQEQAAREKLNELAKKHLAGVKHELLTRMGEPADIILQTAKSCDADVIVMATHGRRGISRFFLGSVAEIVVRQASCPVLTVRGAAAERDTVKAWMTTSPVVGRTDEKLSSINQKMAEGGFRSVPIVDKDGMLVGIVTDRDIRLHTGFLEHTEAFKAMTESLVTIEPNFSIADAARLMRERKIEALPVVDGGKLVGILTITDVLSAFTADK